MKHGTIKNFTKPNIERQTLVISRCCLQRVAKNVPKHCNARAGRLLLLIYKPIVLCYHRRCRCLVVPCENVYAFSFLNSPLSRDFDHSIMLHHHFPGDFAFSFVFVFHALRIDLRFRGCLHGGRKIDIIGLGRSEKAEKRFVCFTCRNFGRGGYQVEKEKNNNCRS